MSDLSNNISGESQTTPKGRKGGNVRKGLHKRGGVWWINFTFDGKRYRRSTKTSDRKLAEKIYNKVLTQLVERQWLDKPEGDDKTFKELADKYVNEYAKFNKRSWQKDAERLNNHLVKFFGEMIVTEITPKIIFSYKIQRYSQGVCGGTINRELTIMKHMYSVAVREWEWTRDNPVKRVKMEKENPPKDRWLAYEEEERLLKACPDWLKEIVIFALNTGLRQGDILSILWKDVDLENGIILLNISKIGTRDSIPLNSIVWDLLRRKASERTHLSSDYVFPSEAGTRMDGGNLRTDFMKALKKAGVKDFRFHDLRHTFATRLVQNGVDLYMVQRLMHHKQIQTTMRYAHHYRESLRAGVKVLDTCHPRNSLAQICHSGGSEGFMAEQENRLTH